MLDAGVVCMAAWISGHVQAETSRHGSVLKDGLQLSVG